MSVRRLLEKSAKALGFWAAMLLSGFVLVVSIKNLLAKEDLPEKAKIDNYQRSMPRFSEGQTYSTKDDYGWTHYYVYLDGSWREYRRVSANGARAYEWNGHKWVRVSNHLSRPATGWYSRQDWSPPPKYPSTTVGTTTPGTTH